MKCPKCGYHSFDHLTSCKKCNHDLTAFKNKYQLRSLSFPKRPLAAQVEKEASTREKGNQDIPAVVSATAETDFDFDFMDGETAPKTPQPSGVDLPALEDPQPSAEDDKAFSWDEESEPIVATAPATDIKAAADFDWDKVSEDPLAGDEFLVEETENDDIFGLDLSWDSDIMPLDKEKPEGEKKIAAEKLPEWKFDDERPPKGSKAPKNKEPGEGPPDPFELRGTGAEAPAPAPAETTGAIRTDLPFERVNGAESGSPTSSAGTAAAPFASEEDQTEDFLAAFAAIPLVKPATSSVCPSPLVRILAMGIDLLLLSVAIVLFLLAGEVALAPGARSLLPNQETLLNLTIPYFLILFSVFFGYFTLFHFLTGQTPGKMLLRLRVESESGAPLAFSQVFLRSTGGLFSLLLLGLGFLAIFFDDRRRGWNDRLAGTLVVTATSEIQMPDEEADDLR